MTMMIARLDLANAVLVKREVLNSTKTNKPIR